MEECVAVGEFLTDAGGGLPGEPRVGHRVIADEVAGGGDSAGDLRALTDVAPDKKKGGADVVDGEDVEKALGDDVIGAVVVGERDFVWIAAGYKYFPEELGFRRECGVGAATGEEACCRECCGGRRDVGSVHFLIQV